MGPGSVAGLALSSVIRLLIDENNCSVLSWVLFFPMTVESNYVIPCNFFMFPLKPKCCLAKTRPQFPNTDIGNYPYFQESVARLL